MARPCADHLAMPRIGQADASVVPAAIQPLSGRYPRVDSPAIIPGPSAGISVGAWRSLAARIVRDDEVGGSNPLAPTITSSSGPNASGNPRSFPFSVGSMTIVCPERASAAHTLLASAGSVSYTHL